MTYRMANGRIARTRDVTLQASTTKTATFNSAAVELGDASSARVDLVVSAHAGTSPTLDVKLQTSKDGTGSGAGAWVDVASFAQITETDGTSRKIFNALDRFVRIVATIGGTTPSYTYSVTAEVL
jgi:hypothetical protein